MGRVFPGALRTVAGGPAGGCAPPAVLVPCVGHPWRPERERKEVLSSPALCRAQCDLVPKQDVLVSVSRFRARTD